MFNKLGNLGKKACNKGFDFAVTTAAAGIGMAVYDGIVYLGKVIRENREYEKEMKEAA